MVVRLDVNKINIDKYNIKDGSLDSSKEYTVIVDFDNEIITGVCFNYGLCDHIIYLEECIELLEDLIKYHKPIRDFTKILEKGKKQITNMKEDYINDK